MKLTTKITAALSVLALLSTTTASVSAAAHSSAEAVFHDARAYTVRIRTQIVTPFAEDSRGAFEGAGFVVDAERGWVLTNAHVVGQSPSTVTAAFADGRL